jgi:hypothetical protein
MEVDWQPLGRPAVSGAGGAALFEVEGGLITAGRLYLEDVEREWIDIEQAVQSLSGRRLAPSRRFAR